MPPPGNKPTTFSQLLYPYKPSADLRFCPSDPHYYTDVLGHRFFRRPHPDDPSSYVLRKCINQAWLDTKIKARTMSDYKWPMDQVLLYERGSFHWSSSNGDLSDPKNPNKQGATFNCSFMDGHVKTVRLPVVYDGEPDYYNTDGKTGMLLKRPGIDPRLYCDTLN